MDGTLFDDDKNISKENLNAMHNIYKQEFADIKFDDETNVIHNISDDLQYFVNNGMFPENVQNTRAGQRQQMQTRQPVRETPAQPVRRRPATNDENSF